MKELKLTLYDVFGYFIPGALVFVALCDFYWASFWPKVPFVIADSPLALWIAAAFAAYLFGHLGQSLGNCLSWIFPGNRKSGGLNLS